MGLRYRQDTTGMLKKLADKIIATEKAYWPLKHSKILFTWREGKPKNDGDGNYIAAEASTLSNKQRDLFGYDFSIEFCEDIWTRLPKRWRYRLMWHELRHCGVEMEENDSGKLVPSQDNDGRIVIFLNPHDIVVKTFKAEVEKFGVDTDEISLFRYLSTIYRKMRKGEVKKYARPGVLKENESEPAEDE